ncbi:hypothetical protein FHS34_000094 [Streptomyces echinatus]|uniref:DUF2510 domain-containing protein n=1 Tax=Streptomyces echinatus TaxID=67293 RepID=A0A7W9UNQ1_9ACTN|nr:hypothetical protein [Streptomyces echinatus]
MSAPTPAPGDDRPREGYYPDPSIPGYVRYWNGASWVPGTSRPAPKDGEPLVPPAGVQPAAPSVEETGPHFFDEDPAAPADTGPRDGADQQGQAGPGGRWARAGGPGPAAQGAQWGRPGQQDRPAGSGGDAGHRDAPGVDPRVPADLPGSADGRGTDRTDGTGTIPPAEHDEAPDPGTFIFRRPIPGPAAARTDDGTMTFRPVLPARPASAHRARPAHPRTRASPPGRPPRPAPEPHSRRTRRTRRPRPRPPAPRRPRRPLRRPSPRPRRSRIRRAPRRREPRSPGCRRPRLRAPVPPAPR